ncbi:general odorant-binding protein 72-like [Achroia grisella]|uniref:general odorant-binding protein 72-like n=1 Tax=Achroia grisella TaxID=688607 RepID=UPI0027D269A6|nr:general odorant-binding protein 72-like [Achroia grisella]
MNWKLIFWFTIGISVNVNSLSRQQFKNSGKTLRKSCMGKTQVAEDLIKDIEQGTFIEDKNVMCYMGCIYKLSQIVKNNKLNYEAMIKQIDLMYPPELKETMKKSVENCKDVPKKYEDVCAQSFWFTKCVYEDDPKNFIYV